MMFMYYSIQLITLKVDGGKRSLTRIRATSDSIEKNNRIRFRIRVKSQRTNRETEEEFVSQLQYSTKKRKEKVNLRNG